jgi:hypothetical protein
MQAHPRQSLAALLERVLAGTLPACDALDVASAIVARDDDLVRRAWDALLYYCEDADSRAADVRYIEGQRRSLANLVDLLRRE